jgi:hypothetical protein
MELIEEMQIKVLNCEIMFVPFFILKIHPLTVW